MNVHRFLRIAVVLGLIVLPAIQPLFSGQLFGADGLLHFHRLVQLDRAVRHGMLYPRWLPDLGYGFGFPLFNYYAPLGYYLLLPLLWLGIPAQTALLVGFALALWALAAAVYLWSRDLFGETAGIVAAFAVVYAPYTLNDVYQRGTLPSLWALAWLTLTAWALLRLTAQPNRRFFLLATLGTAALLLTHNVTSLMGLPLLAAYIFLLGIYYGLRRVFRPLLALALGLGLSACCWAPAFFEKEYVQIHQVYLPAAFDYHHNFISWGQLLIGPRAVDPAWVNPPAPLGLGWVQVALAAACWWPVGATLPRRARFHRWVLSLAVVGLAAMALPVSLPLWDRIPILRFLQFPWRFLAPATLALALLAGGGAELLMRQARWTGPLIFLGMALVALTWLYPLYYPPQQDPSPPDQIRFEAETGWVGATAAGDYLPRWVQEPPSPDALLPLYEAAAPDYIIPRLDPASLPDGARLLEAEYGLTRAHVVLESPEPFRIRFLWYFFPGWQGRLDGRPLPLEPNGPHGLIAANIPAGRHEVTLRFGDTPLRRWAWRVSGLSGLLLLASLFLVRRSQPGAARPEPASGGPLSLWTLGVCALLGVALTGVKTLYLDRYDNPFRRTRFDGRQVRGVDVPLDVNFGNQMVLMGYDLPTPAVRADEPIEVALYWRVLPPVETDYSVGLHLVDDRGILYGQQDNMHPAYPYPTSRLRPDQYARDVHHLLPWEGIPPGRYTLLVIVYDPAGRRLDLRDEAGTSLGATAYPLGPVEIRPPREFPSVEKLPVQKRLDAEVGEGLRIVGVGALPDGIEVGHTFPLTLFWQAVRPPSGDYLARLRLVGADGTVVAEAAQAPGRADFPTSSWRQGEIVRDVWSFSVPVALPADPMTPVPAGTYGLYLDLVTADLRPLSPSTDLGALRVTVPARDFSPPAVAHRVDAHLADMATLLGYGPLPADLQPGETFTLTLYWRADALIDRSYTVFVHLVGPDDHIYAQQDSVPVEWTRPTAGWFPAEFIRDEYRLTVDPAAPSGTYQIRVGWYDPHTGRRVPAVDAGGTPLGDHIVLPEEVAVWP